MKRIVFAQSRSMCRIRALDEPSSIDIIADVALATD
jgi:hypothetical protein